MGEDTDRDHERCPTQRWYLAVAGVVALGVVVRAIYVIVVLDDVPPGLDAVWYQLQGGSIRDGTGYVVPRSLFTDERVPTAAFPPLYPLHQAAWQFVAGTGPDAVRLAGLVPAAAAVWLTAVLGRRTAGPLTGLAAAALVAVHPGVISADGSGMSENLTLPLVLAAQVLALRVFDTVEDRRRVVPAVGLGVVLGLAVLSRQDLTFLAMLLVAWLLLAIPGSWRNKVVVGLVVSVAAVAVVTPWVWRNHRTLDVVAISTLSPTSALAGANCERTYSGRDLGSWDYGCVVAARPSAASEEELVARGVSEAELMESYQDAALTHARSNVERLPIVVAAREARAWGFWDPRDLARRDAEESRRHGWQLMARPLEAAFALAGAVGLFGLLRRRTASAFVLLAPVLTVALSVAVGYGNPRFNVAAQPSLAVAVAWLATSWWRLRPHRPSTR